MAISKAIYSQKCKTSGEMCRVKTCTKSKNSFFPGLIYWNHNRIHLGNIKKLIFVLLVPPLLKEEVGADVEVMKVLRKLQAPQVKHLHIETRILSSGGGAAEPRCGVNEQRDCHGQVYFLLLLQSFAKTSKFGLL